MSLKIIGAGFGRTGTLSTQHALNELGFHCYHMKEIMKKPNKNHLDYWLEVAETSKETPFDWNKIFHNYSATVDFPSSCVWQDLMEAYPEAKIILTIHPKGPEGWYKSTMDTIYGVEKMWEGKVLAYLIPTFRKMRRLTSKLIWGRFLQGTMDSKEDAINRYKAHIEEVKNKVPADNLLIFSVDQGWSPLCKFLGIEAPQTSFPNVNDKAEMKKMIKIMSTVVRAFIALIVVFAMGLIWRMI